MATRFFCPPDSWYGARSASSSISSIAQCVVDTLLDLVGCEAHVQRTEGDLFADCRREDLGVGVLEDEPDPGPEAARELLVLEVVLGDGARRRPDTCPSRGRAGRRAP